jgi:hypothetical protein
MGDLPMETRNRTHHHEPSHPIGVSEGVGDGEEPAHRVRYEVDRFSPDPVDQVR